MIRDARGNMLASVPYIGKGYFTKVQGRFTMQVDYLMWM